MFSATINDYFYKVLREFNIKYDTIDLVQGRDSVPAKIKHLKMQCDYTRSLEDSIVDFIANYNETEVRKIIIFCQMKSEVAKINNGLNAN